MRLIDAIELKQSISISAILEDGKTLEQIIDNAPTIEERKTGRWIYIHTDIDGNALYECSECHKGEVHVPIVEVKYCWNCGARMEG